MTTLVNVGLAAWFNAMFLENFRVSLWAVVALSIPLCVIAMIGDLTASVLKRNLGVKDFGTLMPGHGGAIDRFDSFFFVCPMMLALFRAAQGFGICLFNGACV
jgi:phosphatidate cytidylyltransferase